MNEKLTIEEVLSRVCNLAEDALDANYCTDDEREAAFAAALEEVRHAVRRDWLEMRDFKLARFHAGDATLFVGARKHKQGGGGVVVEARCVRRSERSASIEISCNGECVFDGQVFGGLALAERMAVASVRGLFERKASNAKHAK